jgi:hypothetical protein
VDGKRCALAWRETGGKRQENTTAAQKKARAEKQEGQILIRNLEGCDVSGKAILPDRLGQ